MRRRKDGREASHSLSLSPFSDCRGVFLFLFFFFTRTNTIYFLRNFYYIIFILLFYLVCNVIEFFI